MVKLAYTILTLRSAFGPSGIVQKGTISSSESRRGVAKAAPASNERIAIKMNFDLVFISSSSNKWRKSLLALIIEQLRSTNRTLLVKTFQFFNWVYLDTTDQQKTEKLIKFHFLL